MATETPAAGTSAAMAIDGRSVDPFAGDQGSLGAMVFVSHECPIANAMAPELARIGAAARTRGVDFYAVHPATWADIETARRHAKEFALEDSMTVLVDPSQRLAKAVGATVTPEAAVFRRDGFGGFELLYLGRVNDLYAGIGRRRAQTTSNDLADAIDAAVAGRVTPPPYPKAVGCFIELRR
ncbi:MAG: hypothetical protein ACO3IB_04115 [Phycisphaerales bacterium]